jgi:hypothetical protein
MGNEPTPGKVRAVARMKAEAAKATKLLQLSEAAFDGTRYLRARVNGRDIMRPTLYTGDIAVIDLFRRARQGQVVAVVAAVPRANVGPTTPPAITFTAYRRRFEFAGKEFFVSEHPNGGAILDFGEWWPVVAVEVDELSPFAGVVRPMEITARAAAASTLERLIAVRGIRYQESREAIEASERSAAALRAACEAARRKWEGPGAGTEVSRLAKKDRKRPGGGGGVNAAVYSTANGTAG